MVRKMLFLVLLSLAAVALDGCSLAGKARPVLAYDDASVPLAETAVFSPGAQHPGVPISADGQGGGAFVTMVDGKELLANAVRVRPGTHRFAVGYIVFRAHGGAQVEIRDMKAGHVYGAHIDRMGDRFAVRTADLGSSPDLGIYLGLKGVNMDFFPFDFGAGAKGTGN